MTTLEIIRTFAGVLCGSAIFVLAIAVLYHTDMAQGRWLAAAGWVATVPAALWLMVGQALAKDPPEAWTLALSCTLAVVGWQQLGAIVQRAGSMRTRVVSFLAPRRASRYASTRPQRPDVCSPGR